VGVVHRAIIQPEANVTKSRIARKQRLDHPRQYMGAMQNAVGVEYGDNLGIAHPVAAISCPRQVEAFTHIQHAYSVETRVALILAPRERAIGAIVIDDQYTVVRTQLL